MVIQFLPYRNVSISKRKAKQNFDSFRSNLKKNHFENTKAHLSMPEVLKLTRGENTE